jgi:glycosyltransferase involved in cell wall biosynthesis
MSNRDKIPDLSVVIAIADVEETVGRDVRRLAEHLKSQGIAFEIVAADDGSRDNSWAVLALLQAAIPELRLLPGSAGRAFIRGVAEANGRTVVLWDASRAGALPLAAFGWALSRIASGKHAVILRGRCVVADRLGALAALIGATGRGDLWERSFERRAAHLDLDVVGTRPRRPGLLAPVLRFLAA